MPKTFSVRLSDDLASDIDLLARIEGKTVTEEISEAISRYVVVKQSDPAVARQIELMKQFTQTGA